MHIEPGFVTPAKVLMANTAAIGIIIYQSRKIISQPTDILKVLLSAFFFSIFMQSFHRPVGPSELHFIGASAIYLLFGFTPTLLGFAAGLLLQGVLFEPTDLIHLGVNSLSLIIPLAIVHKTMGQKLFEQPATHRVSWSTILKLDAAYYTGVTSMVGFWLLVSEVPTPFSAWVTFASSYLLLVAMEPFVTYGILRGVKHFASTKIVTQGSVINQLNLA
jgi:cobalt/nickel transport system permease protein